MKKQELNFETIEKIEEELLSELLKNNTNILEEAILKLKPNDFYNREYSVIFHVIQELASNHKDINHLTIINYIDNNKSYQFDDYDVLINTIANNTALTQNFSVLIEDIKNNSIKRKLNEFSEYLKDINFDQNNYDLQANTIAKDLSDILSSKITSDLIDSKKAVESFSEKFRNLGINDESKGITTGFKRLDNIIGCFSNGALIVIAAGTGSGKTAFALNCLYRAAEHIDSLTQKDATYKKDCVLIFSLEMSIEQLQERLVSSISGVSISSYNHQQTFTQTDSVRISDAFEHLKKLSIFYDTSSSISIVSLEAKIQQASMNNHLRLIIIDYLQLIKVDSKKNQSREQEVAYISRALKAIARKYSVPVIALSQINRNAPNKITNNVQNNQQNSHERKDVPHLHQIRESDAITHDADIVAFLQPENNNETNKENDDYIIACHIIKNRSGPTGEVKLRFRKKIQRFDDEK
ncbi:MAG: AAA family ATPase [Mycoplasmataceae bacterium]|jgi:replicative DNA helicase|nr:AAA family ATPase [Mycoplasmataceae bacterium]